MADERPLGPGANIQFGPVTLGSQLSGLETDSACTSRPRCFTQGRFPDEASYYENKMDDIITDTQPLPEHLKERRCSSISAKDEADIICILQPASPLAYDVVDVVKRATPQHTLQRDEPDIEDDVQSDIPRDRTIPGNNMEIALRITSKVRDPRMGFVFGRDPLRCDIVLEHSGERKMHISNVHFRIFVNPSGIVMLEDISTNGTEVDGKFLRGKDLTGTAPKMQMLVKGSIISIILSPELFVKFQVTMPNRDRSGEAYARNIRRYIQKTQIQNNRHAAAPLPFLAQRFHTGGPDSATQEPPEDAQTDTMLAAGSTPFNCGGHWNGGEEYNIIEHIGKGAFAEVYKIATKAEGEIFAVKEIEKKKCIKNGVLDSKVMTELKIIKCLNHPHIVKYIDHKEKPEYLFIIMEFVRHGDMMHYLNTHGALQEPHCQSIARQISHALNYLHNCGITHRDIKPDNILIAGRNPFLVKVSDFGLSKAIDNDETFLKTFCGTLLYCAPEVYPDYESYKKGLPLKKRNRHLDIPSKTSAYSSAVDIWSFAAVLFQFLCDKPPFKGTAGDRGPLMLKTIMENQLDTSPLRQSGVSGIGISFLEQMLRINPTKRPTAAECLQHLWLRDVPDVTLIAMKDDLPPKNLADIREEDEGSTLHASKMSTDDTDDGVQRDVSGSEDDAYEVSAIGSEHLPKRVRAVRHHLVAQQEQRSLDSFGYPTLPIVDQINQMHVSPAPPRRLFGEIGTSDLQSSRVLNSGARAALQILTTNSDLNEASEHANQRYLPGYLLPDAPVFQPRHTGSVYQRNQPVGSAASLMSTEAQICQLNMGSPESAASAFTNPTTPATREVSPAERSLASIGSKRSRLDFDPGNEGPTPKRTKLPPRQVTPDMPSYWYDDNDPTTHNLEYASRVSGHDFTGEYETRLSMSRTSSLHGVRSAMKSTTEVEGPHKLPESNLPSTRASLEMTGTKEQLVSMPQDRQDVLVSTRPGPSENITATISAREVAGAAKSTASSVKKTPANDHFVKPSRRAGKLIPVEGSVPCAVVNIDQRVTYWGRDPTSTCVYPHAHDTRVPKAAIDIVFWRAGIEGDLEKGADYTEMPDVIALIHTRASKSIKINGVELKMHKAGGWTYGILKHGDIITVFEGASGFLKFRCEFYLGLSQTPRGPGDPFVVQEVKKEVAKKFMDSRSGLSSGGSSMT